MTDFSASSDGCLVCGETTHQYNAHLNEVEVPSFVGSTVRRLHDLERSGQKFDGLVEEMGALTLEEQGGRRAWAIWLFHLLEELEEASDAPDVASEIEAFLSTYSD